MALKTFYEKYCWECGKEQTGREESNDRIWWISCNCKQMPGPVDYPRLVSKKNITEPDYTEIKDERIRGKICELMSEMLDNPDKHGIYSTSKFMWRIERFVLSEIIKAQQPKETQ